MKALLALAVLFTTTLGCGSSAPLGAPSNLTVKPSGGGAHLTWMDHATAEDEFQVERKDPGGSFVKKFTVTFDITVYHDSQVTAGSTYSYRVRAASSSGVSEYSNEASLTVQ
ncbi:MAG: fibronectin type III domain-containing protein [Myxococcales bacterium]|nr:fibronectin type III domain-containing protein [Myxococcales bacterium]